MSQASSSKAKLFIRLANDDPFPSDKYRMLLANARKRKNGRGDLHTSKEIRIEQKMEDLRKSIAVNEERKSGQRRGTARDKNEHKQRDLSKPDTETKTMTISDFQRKVQMRYIVKEIIHRKFPIDNPQTLIERTNEEAQLNKIKTVKGLKVELRRVLQVQEDGSGDKDKSFKTESALCQKIGGAPKLKGWKDSDEVEFLLEEARSI